MEKFDAADGEHGQARSPYRPPVFNRLGTLRDVTMTSSNHGANDGMTNKGTKRGGDFESIDDGR
jgi:hypothetical protein